VKLPRDQRILPMGRSGGNVVAEYCAFTRFTIVGGEKTVILTGRQINGIDEQERNFLVKPYAREKKDTEKRSEVSAKSRFRQRSLTCLRKWKIHD